MKEDKEVSPPLFAQKFLGWFCSEEFLEVVEGDLYEEFIDNVDEKGLRKAQLIYIKTVLLSFRLYQIRKPQNKTFISLAMLLNYFKIAYRSLLKHKSYSFINIIGLSFGISCFLIIGLYIEDEMMFDKFHEQHENIYRITEKQVDEKGEKYLASVAYQPAEQAQEQLSEIKDAVTFFSYGRVLISNPENNFSTYVEYNFTTPNLFKVFDFKVLKGDKSTFLIEPQSVILDESTAIQLFGTTDVIGKSLSSGRDNNPFIVKGVIEDFPNNSHLQLNILFSISTISEQNFFKRVVPSDWTSNYFTSYLLLDDGADAAKIEEQINDLAKANRKEASVKRSYILQKLDDIHFGSSQYQNDANFNKNDINYIYIMAIAALLILIIACFNYMNLATARSVARSKEIGIRKVAGAFRSSIIMQFLAESILLTTFCVIISIAVVSVVLPSFNQFTNKALSINPLENNWLIPALITLSILVGIVSGLYPALFLSKFQAATVLKSAGTKINSNMTLRRVLVTFQFVVSISLTIATLVTFVQMQYIKDKDLGFDKDLMLVADINSGLVRVNFQTLKNEYGKIPEVQKISVSSRVPGEWKLIPKALITKQGQPEEMGKEMYFLGVDEDFISTFDIKLINGENFTGSPSDSNYVIINETAAQLLGISQAANQQVVLHHGNYNGIIENLESKLKVNVRGIVKDFHYKSLHEEISPLIIAYKNNPIHAIDYFTMKLDGKNLPATLDKLEETLHKVDPEHIFEYHFLDDQLALFYENDERRGLIFTISAIVAISIACLGMIALVSFSTRQKQKEIGIRKVHGASTFSITYLLSKEFFILIVIALFMATPIAWYSMEHWLNIFAYHINFSPIYILVTGIFMLLLTIFSVGFQAIYAASKNPVDTLRSE
ncbi:ABC transporter permease [Chondrinema litorale]|uniref:ABC transporter permease n=1 Tax=Chondrinema litorale TaxID=2994555 RepID=UPI002543FAAA|nr:ABC transporter permease [Chondrinema litorale]UZR93707.1 ABC transporter permease [Chondrinema litorale]